MTHEGAPRLSVVLPVYNGEEYLTEAVESVLYQSFGDFEFIIINDGSTDASEKIIRRYSDSRIHYYQQDNQGLASTLNRGIALARGEYLARQDQDDICFPERFEKQVKFLDEKPDVGMVGTAAEIWAGHIKTDRVLRHPAEDSLIRFGLFFHNHFVHSSVMIRKAVLDDVGGYAEDLGRQPPEDYELWSRVMKSYKLGNLTDTLMVYREVEGSMSRMGVNPFVPNLIKISCENLAWASGFPVDAPEVVALAGLHQGVYQDVSRDISIYQLIRVLKTSMGEIQAENQESARDLSKAYSREVRKIIYHYFNWRSGGAFEKLLKSRIGRFLGSMAK